MVNADSPEQLAARIKISHGSAPHGTSLLASWRSYRARLSQFQKWEAAAAAAWMHRRAEADARREAQMADPVTRFWARYGLPAGLSEQAPTAEIPKRGGPEPA